MVQVTSTPSLLLLDMDHHPMKIVIGPGCQLFAHAPDFFKELVLYGTGRKARFPVPEITSRWVYPLWPRP